MKNIFSHPTSEKEITRAIIASFAKEMEEYVESDVIIIGAGPSGLIAGKNLAEQGFKVLIIERNNYLGGGFWIGGYLMNKVTVRAPAHEQLAALGVPCTHINNGLYIADGPHACSKLIAAACDSGVKFLNMTSFDDLILREDSRVRGAVINWTPVNALPRQITCVDPVALESYVVIDATGHDACVARRLRDRGLLKTFDFGAMWVTQSEEAIVEQTGEVYPGLVCVGMSVATVYGLPRMGPTFGGMLLSGLKGAEETARICRREPHKASHVYPMQKVAHTRT
jgi:thiazole biosynthesis enzyme